MWNKLSIGNRTFEDSAVKSAQLHIACSLLSSQLEANTMEAVVKSADRTLIRFARNTPLVYSHRGRERFRGYLQAVDRIGPGIYSISATSAIGLLMERPHPGGIYTGQASETVVREIVGTIPFTIKGTIGKEKLYGWLPYANPPDRSARDNLAQVLFALGAAIKTDLDGVLRIEPLWNGVSGTVGWDSICEGARAQYGGAVSSVSVTEHHYMIGGEETTLFEGDALSGDLITFSEPMYGLAATGFRILESGANYARLSTGNGALTGKQYIHNTRQIIKPVTAGVPESIQSVTDATLVSLINSNAVAERLANYYQHTETIHCDVILAQQSPGDVLDIYHPYDRENGAACVESLDITASKTLKASLTARAGFFPKQVEQTVTYDQHQVITSSGTVTLPDGVTSMRAVLIGGGTGGTAGAKGADGTSGQSTSNSGTAGSTITRPSYGPAGNGGSGGGAGGGGSGGRVASYEIKGAIKTLNISIGGGGAGGASNGAVGSEGGNTTLTVNGTTYSSGSGTSSSGYQDLVTGTVYGSKGGTGNGGAKGGDGTAPTYTPDDWASVFRGSPGSSAGSNSGGSGGSPTRGGGTYTVRITGGGGGGGAAYNSPGGSAGSTSGGSGAAGTRPATPATPGKGGTGGNGGGGGGGGGGTLAAASMGQSITATAGSGGSGGAGGPGGYGASGCVILYYGVPEKVKSGSPVDKNNRFWLDKLGRLFVT